MISAEQQTPTLDQIEHNAQQVMRRIQRAAEGVGRDPDSVQVVAVTKGFPAETIRLAARAGLRQIGENRVEQATSKRQVVADLDFLEWHMVGHLQSRKAALVPHTIDVVHSVDRAKIARLLNQRAAAAGVRLRVLLQCNVSGEATKGGWPLIDPDRWPDILPQFAQIAEMPQLELLGLMTMAPLAAEAETVRIVFRKLRGLAEYLRTRIDASWDTLSMGMSDDFEVAVQEGATMLRIGRALFGSRPHDG